MIEQAQFYWRDENLVNPRIRVNVQVKSIFMELQKKKECLWALKATADHISYGRILSKLSINKRDINEYDRRIELIAQYSKGKDGKVILL